MRRRKTNVSVSSVDRRSTLPLEALNFATTRRKILLPRGETRNFGIRDKPRPGGRKVVTLHCDSRVWTLNLALGFAAWLVQELWTLLSASVSKTLFYSDIEQARPTTGSMWSIQLSTSPMTNMHPLMPTTKNFCECLQRLLKRQKLTTTNFSLLTFHLKGKHPIPF